MFAVEGSFMSKFTLLFIGLFTFCGVTFAQAICGDPSSSPLKNANDCYLLGKYSKAIEFGKRVVDVEKNNARAYAIIAMAYTRNNQPSESIPYYKKAMELGANTYDVFAFYAMSLDASGNTEDAIKWNKRALIINPNLRDVTGNLANQLVRIGKKQEALELLQNFDKNMVGKGAQPQFRGQILVIQDSMDSSK
jgi:tetratricopeptide (TPR) repeat protein